MPKGRVMRMDGVRKKENKMAALGVTEDGKANGDGKYRVSKKTLRTIVHSRVTRKGGNLRGNIRK